MKALLIITALLFTNIAFAQVDTLTDTYRLIWDDSLYIVNDYKQEYNAGSVTYYPDRLNGYSSNDSAAIRNKIDNLHLIRREENDNY